jgi:hypothetical protein
LPFFFRTFGAAEFEAADLIRASRFLYPEEELKVRRIEYASPGIKDVAGFGAIVGHLKDFTQFLVQHWGSRNQRKLLEEEQQLKNDALRIQNARNFVSLAKDVGVSDGELRRLVGFVDEKQEALVRLVVEGKIQSATILDEGKQE